MDSSGPNPVPAKPLGHSGESWLKGTQCPYSPQWLLNHPRGVMLNSYEGDSLWSQLREGNRVCMCICRNERGCALMGAAEHYFKEPKPICS